MEFKEVLYRAKEMDDTEYVPRIFIKQNIWKNVGLCCNGGQIFWMQTGRSVSVRLNMQKLTIKLMKIYMKNMSAV